MRLEIKKMRLENFRGFTHQEIEFNDNTKVLGSNGQGKTTLFFAWMWLMSDKSDSLVSNPSITPKDMKECESKVEVEITIDGQLCTISKSQKYKEKVDDSGKVTSNIVNRFTINGVDKTATNFIADLKERRIDMDNFLILSHVLAFTADTSKKGREEMRKVLFEMVDGISDLDIAKELNVPDITAQLEKGYKIEEIEQMAKGNLKSLNDRYGKSNELIDSKISGIIESKSTLDEAVLAEQYKNYSAEIERIERELSNISGKKADFIEQIAKLKIKKTEIETKANADIEEKWKTFDRQVKEFTGMIDEHSFQLEQAKKGAQRVESSLSEKKADIEKQRVLYKMEQDAVLDEGDLICPTCKRTYDKSKLAEIKADFEQHKTDRLKTIKASGETLYAQIKEDEVAFEEFNKKVELLTDTIDKLQKQRDEVQQKLDTLPSGANLSTNTEYMGVTEEIARIEAELSKDDDELISNLKSQLNVNKTMLDQVKADLGAVEHNKELDEKISALRAEKKNAEIQRAGFEKTMFEVETFKKAKNDKLSDSINAHFNIAQFKLFKTLKNGSVEDACDILVEGKELNSQLNQSTQILALTDVIAGLQEFKQQYLPVFLDNHALFTEETDKRIPLKCQTIKLIAAEGKNLQIERG